MLAFSTCQRRECKRTYIAESVLAAVAHKEDRSSEAIATAVVVDNTNTRRIDIAEDVKALSL